MSCAILQLSHACIASHTMPPRRPLMCNCHAKSGFLTHAQSACCRYWQQVSYVQLASSGRTAGQGVDLPQPVSEPLLLSSPQQTSQHLAVLSNKQAGKHGGRRMLPMPELHEGSQMLIYQPVSYRLAAVVCRFSGRGRCRHVNMYRTTAPHEIHALTYPSPTPTRPEHNSLNPGPCPTMSMHAGRHAAPWGPHVHRCQKGSALGYTAWPHPRFAPFCPARNRGVMPCVSASLT